MTAWPRTMLGAPAALLIAAALASAPCAAAVVPPGNSAVNQYTETYPSAGGNVTGGGVGGRPPAKALGARNAHLLEALGPEGRAASAVAAAATAPPPAMARLPGRSGRQAPGSGGKRSSGAAGRASGEGHGDQAGSSGLSQVIAQATGSSSSGQMGLLLPLVIALSLIGSISFALSRRRESPRGGQ